MLCENYNLILKSKYKTLKMRSLAEDQREQRLDDLHELKESSEKVETQQEKNARDVSPIPF